MIREKDFTDLSGVPLVNPTHIKGLRNSRSLRLNKGKERKGKERQGGRKKIL